MRPVVDLSGYSTERLLDAHASLTHRIHALRVSSPRSDRLADAVASVRAQRNLVREEIVRRCAD